MLRDELCNKSAECVSAYNWVTADSPYHVRCQRLLNCLLRKGREQYQGGNGHTRTETAQDASKAKVNKTSKNKQQLNGNFTHQESSILEDEEPPLEPPSLVGGGYGHIVLCSRRSASATSVRTVVVSHPTLTEFAHKLGLALLDSAQLLRGTH